MIARFQAELTESAQTVFRVSGVKWRKSWPLTQVPGKEAHSPDLVTTYTHSAEKVSHGNTVIDTHRSEGSR